MNYFAVILLYVIFWLYCFPYCK